MARDGLRSLLCAGVLLGVMTSSTTAGDDYGRLHATLAWQTALERGRAYLRAQNYEAAVKVLESQIARIEGSREYLIALRDAYRGHIKNLHLAGRTAEAQQYASLLAILEKGPPLDPPKPAPAPPTAPTPAKATALPPEPVRATPPPTPLEPVKARAKIDQPPPPPKTDPFAAANNKRLNEARNLLARAEQEFRSEHYRQAGELYARAYEALPDVLGTAAGRWGYCRLNGVTERLKQQDRPPTAVELGELEKEVKTAISTTPALKDLGLKCLKTIEQHRLALAPPPAAVPVKHTPRQSGATWAVAETTNFRVFHNQEQAYAERVIRLAELTRAAMQQKWFGKVEPAWNPRCDIYLHASAQAYSQATRAPATSPGHSYIERRKGTAQVTVRRMDLHVDELSLLVGVLPHETTHVVLAGRFGPHDIPRWADEGMAVLTEPRNRIERHLRNLPQHREANQLFSMRQLLAMPDYPEPQLIGPFYAESVSLVEYLCELHGPQAFARFLADGLSSGYEAALKKHYGLRGFEDLESRWQARTFNPGTPTQGVARRQ
jgi:tetratricopeptide (TPR) repeat protein